MKIETLTKKFEQICWSVKTGFDFYGTRVGFKMDDGQLINKIRQIFPNKSIEIPFDQTVGYFALITKQSSELNGFYWVENEVPELALGFEQFEELCLAGIELKILFALAMISPPKMFYFHAGAISINGKGIIIPGGTYSGKTTLTEQFIRNGAVYYSDDCSLIDSEGFLYPYPIKLGVRQAGNREYFKAADLGALEGVEPVKIEYILLTKFEKDGVWKPQFHNLERMAFKLIEHLFYPLSINRKPSETIKFVAGLVRDVQVIESSRGEALEVVEWFNNYLVNSKRQKLKKGI